MGKTIMEKEWCSNYDVRGYSTGLRAKGVRGRERPHLSESVRYPGTAAQPRVARLGCYLCEYCTRLGNLSRICRDCHCELVPLSGVFGSRLQLMEEVREYLRSESSAQPGTRCFLCSVGSHPRQLHLWPCALWRASAWAPSFPFPMPWRQNSRHDIFEEQ